MKEHDAIERHGAGPDAARAQVCALADGALAGDELAQAIALATTDEDARASWHAYHVIGDVLRSGSAGFCGRDRAFADRLMARIAQESQAQRAAWAVANAPENGAASDRLALGNPQKHPENPPAANDEVFRWKLVAGLASVAAVAAIGWSVVGLGGAEFGSGAQLARAGAGAAAPAPVVAQTQSAPMTAVQLQGPMIRDPQLDELLAAHRQFGGTTALENASGFLRNATFETPVR